MTARDYSAPAAPGPNFERVASVIDVPEGTLLPVVCGTTRICLVNHAGRIGAIADQCTHQAFPMSEGTLDPDGTIECAWHGARFDSASGAVRQGPADEPLTVFEVRVHDGAVWVGPRQ